MSISTSNHSDGTNQGGKNVTWTDERDTPNSKVKTNMHVTVRVGPFVLFTFECVYIMDGANSSVEVLEARRS